MCIRDSRIAGNLPQIVRHSGGQQVGADKVRRTVTGTLLLAPADITILLAGGVLVTLLVKDAAAVGTKESVSYTHLDVYKRQELSGLSSSSALSKTNAVCCDSASLTLSC